MKFFIVSTLFLVLLLPSAYAADVYVFSSPENSYSGIWQFVQNEKSFNISVYEFTSPEIADLVSGKAQNVLVEKSPVGGMKEIEEKILCTLASKGIKIKLYNKKGILHAKYIVGSSVLVSSENFGSGFFENRGWGAIVEDEKTRKDFQKVFDEDFRTSENFKCGISEYSIKSKKNYPKTGIKKYSNQGIDTVFAPDNAVEKILSLIGSANKSIYIEQFYIYKNWGKKSEPKPNLFLVEAIQKAKSGVEVKILMDSNSYNVEKDDPNSNLNTAEFVNNFSDASIEAKLADLESINANKIHNKGIIIDEKSALISSINWNENSPTRNRESGIIIHGQAAEYFVDLFKKDFGYEKIGLSGKLANRGIELVIIIAITIIAYGAIKYFRRDKKHFY